MDRIEKIRRKISKTTAKKSLGISDEELQVRTTMLTKYINFGEGREVTLDMMSELDVKSDDLDGEMRKQAASYGFISVCCEVSSRNAEKLENVLEELRATRYFEMKNGDFAKIYPEVRMTEEAIKHAMLLDDEIKAATENWQRAVHDSKILSSYKNALNQKKDMLQSLNSSQNRDYK